MREPANPVRHAAAKAGERADEVLPFKKARDGIPTPLATELPPGSSKMPRDGFVGLATGATRRNPRDRRKALPQLDISASAFTVILAFPAHGGASRRVPRGLESLGTGLAIPVQDRASRRTA